MRQVFPISRNTQIALLVFAVILGVSTASMASEFMDGSDLPDNSPKSGSERIDATTTLPESSRHSALLVYENKRGEICVATGDPSPDHKSVGRQFPSGFVQRPLNESGMCGLKPNPIAFAGEFDYGRSMTGDAHPRSSVFGVVDASVKRISVNIRGSGEELAVTTPGEKGGFILSISGIDHKLELKAVLKDGSIVTKRLPSAPPATSPGPLAVPEPSAQED